MEIRALGITDRKAQQLERIGIKTTGDLLSFFPRKYQDRSVPTGIMPSDVESVFYMVPQKVMRKFGKPDLVIVTGVLSNSDIPMKVIWFNQSYRYEALRGTIGKNVLVCGEVDTEEYRGEWTYRVTSPTVFDDTGEAALGIYPIYHNVAGMSQDYLKEVIQKAAMASMPLRENIPEQIVADAKLMSHDEMVRSLHWPPSVQMLDRARQREVWEDLLYFALRIELDDRDAASASSYGLPKLQVMRDVEASLPYELTPDQKAVLEEAIQVVRSGKRLDGLIQGDVGCGKTIVAILLMIAFAENGYQAVLMAPTQILAQQHYDALRQIAEPLGFPVAFVSGQKLRKAEQSRLESGIATGHFKLVVGTQALLSQTYQFDRLALILEDEEHKYGVMQRKTLMEKAAGGTHTVGLSATPIPRSLAKAIHGERKQLYNIMTRPAGRKPIKTGIAKSMEDVYRYLHQDITKHGHQAYVVCPMISPNEKVPSVASVEEVYKSYESALSPYGIRVEVITGKTKKDETAQILKDFADNKVAVLVSTTVIEVGINVPNATTMVIHDAERFGLAQLHQLRGRVGRGKSPGICVLVSKERDNDRLMALCNHTDGFKIAEIDLELRGAGDFLGTKQSGTEKYLALALAHPQEYKEVQAAAREILNKGYACDILDKAVADRQSNAGGVMIS